jgi:hypothetical protein
MKYLFQLLLILSITSCATRKNSIELKNNSNVIVYILPDMVGKLLREKVDKNNSNTYFFMGKRTKNEYYIYVVEYDKNNKNKIWVKNSSRKVFLEGSFYPLIFDTDEEFATTDSAQRVVSKYLSEKYPVINKNYTLFHGYHIDFNSDGEIIYKGNK